MPREKRVGRSAEVRKLPQAHGKRTVGAGFGLEEAVQSARKERGERERAQLLAASLTLLWFWVSRVQNSLAKRAERTRKNSINPLNGYSKVKD